LADGRTKHLSPLPFEATLMVLESVASQPPYLIVVRWHSLIMPMMTIRLQTRSGSVKEVIPAKQFRPTLEAQTGALIESLRFTVKTPSKAWCPHRSQWSVTVQTLGATDITGMVESLSSCETAQPSRPVA
jgi:hypothetical protein